MNQELIKTYKIMSGTYLFLGYTNECVIKATNLVVVKNLKNKCDNDELYQLFLSNNILIIKRWIEDSKEWITETVLSQFTLLTIKGEEYE